MVIRVEMLMGLLIAITAIPASAKETILCQSTGSPDVVITLDASTRFNHTLDCIAGNFVVDMTPCAPDGGYGLSAPTGAANLVGVIDRGQDYADHIGGVVSHYIKDNTIYFAGGFNAPDNGGLTGKWSFVLNRLTGQAELKKLSGPAKSVRYECH